MDLVRRVQLLMTWDYHLLVACRRLYKLLSIRQSVRRSVGPSHFTFFRKVAYRVAFARLMAIGLVFSTISLLSGTVRDAFSFCEARCIALWRGPPEMRFALAKPVAKVYRTSIYLTTLNFLGIHLSMIEGRYKKTGNQLVHHAK